MTFTKVTNTGIGSTGTVLLQNLDVIGIVTAGFGVSTVDVFTTGVSTFSGNATFGGNVSIGGTLTYEDVTNVDSVGLITARNGIEVTDKGVQVGTGATVDSAGTNILSFLTNSNERLRIDAAGRVLYGRLTNRQSRLGPNQFNPNIQIEDESIGSASLARFNDNVSPFRLLLQKGRGSIDSPTTVQENDVAGQILFSAHDGSNFCNTAKIDSEVNGPVGVNSMPGNLTFSTTAAGAFSVTERLRITESGDILTQGLEDHTFNNASASTKVLEITGDGTDGKYGVLNISGNSNSTGLVAAIKFINRENSNANSGSNSGSRNVAMIDCFAETSDSNAGDDSGGYMRFVTKPESGNMAERMRISSIGYVSGNVNVPAWFGSQDSATTVANGTWTTVTNLGNNVVNPSMNNSGWDESSGIFTVQSGQAGVYFVFGGAAIDDVQDSDVVRAGFSVNNATPTYLSEQRCIDQGANVIVNSGTINGLFTLAVGDTIRLKVYHNEGTSESTEQNRCFFGGYRIST